MSATSPVFLGHGPDRFVRTGGVLSGSAIVRAAEASGTARGFVVLGEDADGIFAAEVTGSLAFEALDVSPDGSWLRASADTKPAMRMCVVASKDGGRKDSAGRPGGRR